jgi:hypothetical protein
MLFEFLKMQARLSIIGDYSARDITLRLTPLRYVLFEIFGLGPIRTPIARVPRAEQVTFCSYKFSTGHPDNNS